MYNIGKITIGDRKYTINVEDRVQQSITSKNIDAQKIIATIVDVGDELENNIGDDMFIPNEDDNFILVASIEEHEVNILSLVLDENVIYTTETK